MRSVSLALIVAFLVSGVECAKGNDTGIITIQEENDFFTPDNRDRHYTQGAQIGYLSPELAPDGLASAMDWLGATLPIFGEGETTRSRRFHVFAGQEIFTPQNKELEDPDPNDRPYAGWLNGGIGLIQDTDQQTLEHLEIQLGIVGPASLAKQTQNNFHLAIDDPLSRGWGFQLRNEPTVNFYYDYHRRFIEDLGGAISADVIPAAGAAVGNAFDYLSLGARARIGQNLRADYGPPISRPARQALSISTEITSRVRAFGAGMSSLAPRAVLSRAISSSTATALSRADRSRADRSWAISRPVRRLSIRTGSG